MNRLPGAVSSPRIFLIGNPNSGKTSLFNALTGERQRVGNWPGVTVERLEGALKIGCASGASPKSSQQVIEGGGPLVPVVTDLPGTYSLSPLTPEETIALSVLEEAQQGILVNVIDASNLERNLFLTIQLLELGFRPVLVLNCFDGLSSSGAKLIITEFARRTGCPAIPTVARVGEGVDSLNDFLRTPGLKTFSPAKDSAYSGLGNAWQTALASVLALSGLTLELAGPLQRQQAIGELVDVRKENSRPELGVIRERLVESLAGPGEKPPPVAEIPCKLAEDRYNRIVSLLGSCYCPAATPGRPPSDRLDSVLAHRWLGIPFFIMLVGLVFWSTFFLGEIPASMIRAALGLAQGWAKTAMNEGLLRDLLADGILSGVGGVLVFLPNVAILFFWLALLEDSGYLARAAYLMDYFMQKMGLHGRAFIPLLVGFGCNVPAIMATRIIEHRGQRLLAMFLLPMVTCTARLPVLVLLCGAFFPRHPGSMLMLLYFLDIGFILLVGNIISRLLSVQSTGSFMLEMPAYRLPTWRSMREVLLERVSNFIGKAGSIIIVGSVLIWFLTAFPREVPFSMDYDAAIAKLAADGQSSSNADRIESLRRKRDQELISGRWISVLGRALHPLVAPLGFGWRESVSLIPGFLAKEVILSTMAILYAPVDSNVGSAMVKEGMTPLSGFVFMIFTILYVPCLPTLAIIFRESGSRGFTALALILPGVIAWIVGFAVYQIGMRLTGWSSGISAPGTETLLVLALVLFSVVVLIRRAFNEVSGGACACCSSRHSCGKSSVQPGGSCEESKGRVVKHP